MVAVRVLLVAAGLAVALSTVLSSVRTTVLPRAVPSRLSRAVFLALRKAFDLWLGRAASYERRDRVFANYGPFALLLLLAVWLVLVLLGFAVADGAAEDVSVVHALRLSGSSLFTLGFEVPHSTPALLLVYLEAGFGLLLVALLISYLPAIYGAFSRREAVVNKLEVRASPPGGGPPDGASLLIRSHQISQPEKLTQLWVDMESWFVDIEETHTTFPVLVFFRSPDPAQSWITSAGAILDAAALLDSTVDAPRVPEGNLCLRAGFLALRAVADFFQIPYPHDPRPGDPVSVRRDEYDAAYDRLAAAGVAVRADRDAAWRDFAGWRVNYDRVLIALATLTQAPYAPWSSDRSLAERVVPHLFGRRRAAVPTG